MVVICVTLVTVVGASPESVVSGACTASLSESEVFVGSAAGAFSSVAVVGTGSESAVSIVCGLGNTGMFDGLSPCWRFSRSASQPSFKFLGRVVCPGVAGWSPTTVGP